MKLIFELDICFLGETFLGEADDIRPSEPDFLTPELFLDADRFLAWLLDLIIETENWLYLRMKIFT